MKCDVKQYPKLTSKELLFEQSGVECVVSDGLLVFVWMCSASSECKLLLWWFEMVALCLRQIDFGAEHLSLIHI